jgi:hypothetical protein
MKPERIVLVLALLLLAAALVVGVAGGAVALQRWGLWLGLAALGVLALPLLLWLVDVVIRAARR